MIRDKSCIDNQCGLIDTEIDVWKKFFPISDGIKWKLIHGEQRHHLDERRTDIARSTSILEAS